MKKQKNKNHKLGFTLLELLVVVLIIGILAAIALPQYNKAIWKSRFVQAKTLARNIANAEELYYTVNGKYTKDFKTLDIDLTPNRYDTNNSYAYFNWGYCLLNSYSNRHEVHCVITKNNQEYLRYLLEFANGNYFLTNKKTKAVCAASGESSKPKSRDINYKVCKGETKDQTPYAFGTTSLGWIY